MLVGTPCEDALWPVVLLGTFLLNVLQKASPYSHQPTDEQISDYVCGRYKRITCFSRDGYKPHKKKTGPKLPSIMCYVCSKKCRMLTLTFLRDSYVTWEQRRLQITKFQAFGGLLGTFGGHFGSILGTFLTHFGGPERTWKHIAYKRGGSSFSPAVLGPNKTQN